MSPAPALGAAGDLAENAFWVTADALTLAVGVSLTGLLRPLLGGRLTTGVLVCEVEGLNGGLLVPLAVVDAIGVEFPLPTSEGEGRGGGAGDRVRDPVPADVVDRKDAELGVERSVGRPVDDEA